MKKCPNCEKHISDYILNCPNCGMALSKHAENTDVIPKDIIEKDNQIKIVRINVILLLIINVMLEYNIFWKYDPYTNIVYVVAIIYLFYTMNKINILKKNIRIVILGIVIGITIVGLEYLEIWIRSGIDVITYLSWIYTMGKYTAFIYYTRALLQIIFISALVINGYYLIIGYIKLKKNNQKLKV